MTSEPDALGEALRRVASVLDAAVPPTDLVAARRRRPAAPSRPRGLVAAAVVLVLVVAGAVVAVLAVDRDDQGVRTDDPTTSTMVSTSTSTTTVPEVTTTTADPEAPVPLPSYRGPALEDLPRAGLAFVAMTGEVALTDPYGVELATFAAVDVPRIGWDPADGLDLLFSSSGSPEPTAALRPVATGDDDGCLRTGSGGVLLAVCGAERPDSIERISPAGERTVLTGPFAGSLGRYRWAEASPDGRWVMAAFSGECEASLAILVPADGGTASTADGFTRWGGAEGPGPAESEAVAWTPDGRAVVQFPEVGCDRDEPGPGTYLVDPASGERTLLRAGAVDRVIRWERRDDVIGNDLDRALRRARAELGLEPGDVGDWSATSVSSSLIWEGRVIGARAASLPDFVPDPDATDGRSAEVDGLPVTTFRAGGSDHLAFTCDGAVWTLGGGADAPALATDVASLRRLASALVPHLYCTVGDPPDISR